jgi:hypothetical protein
MKAQVNGEKLDQDYKQNEKVFTNPDESLVWTIKADGNYFTLYNESTQKYAAGTKTDNQLTLVSSVTNYSRWTASGTSDYSFKNMEISTGSPYLGYNDPNFGCYKKGKKTVITLYKKEVATSPLSSIALSGSYPTEFTEGMEAGKQIATICNITELSNHYK